MNWRASCETDADLIAGRDLIASDSESAALDFLNAAFEAFDQLARFLKWDLRQTSGTKN